MRFLLILALLVTLMPAAMGEYLLVDLSVTPDGVVVEDIELSFTGSLLSSDTHGRPVTVEVIDESWHTVSRARVTASVIEVASGPSSATIIERDAGRASALVEVSEEALFLVARSEEGEGRIIDLRAASCGSTPVCEDCARAFPEWCLEAARRADRQGPVDRGVLFGVLLNIVVVGTIAVLLMSHRKT